jgi:hypothetical protein
LVAAVYGLLENPFNPRDRRLRMIWLSPKGRGLVQQIATAADERGGVTWPGQSPFNSAQSVGKIIPITG